MRLPELRSALTRNPSIRHILPSNFQPGTPNIPGTPVSPHGGVASFVSSARRGAVDPSSGVCTPRDMDFKFRTVKSLQESIVKVSGSSAEKAGVMRSKIKHALVEAGITYDSLEVRDYDSQDEEDGVEPGQILVAMTRGDKIDLDQYIGICEKVVINFAPAEIIGTQQGFVVNWSTSNVHSLVYAPDSDPPTPRAFDDSYFPGIAAIEAEGTSGRTRLGVGEGLGLVKHV